MIALAAPLGACATVSVYEAPKTTEFSVAQAQSGLHDAANAYCETARAKGLATGEAGLGSIFTGGKHNDKNAYWRRIGADKSAPASVVSRVRADTAESAKGLADLSRLARTMLGKTTANKEDVNLFEKALIHARQSRDSFSDALTEVNKRSQREYKIDDELVALDTALQSARVTADELAASRVDKS
ncbi:MAG TPA: hypothetical protein VGO52_09835 [Hyphomonadaceae bacterium]|jgi:hypothetical protein|nr:hypothetical protein [Hyphomonadaceae bacterium]